MRLFVKADKDYADPQRAFSSSEFEREKQESTSRMPKLPAHTSKAYLGEAKIGPSGATYSGTGTKKEGAKVGSGAVGDKPFQVRGGRRAAMAMAGEIRQGKAPTVAGSGVSTKKAVTDKEDPEFKKEKREGVEKAMEPTNDAIDILKANSLKTDEGYQAAISALVDAGMRQNQLEGWVGIHDLTKSLEPYYGKEAYSLAHTVGWQAFQEGALATGGNAAMVESLIKACKSEKAYLGEAKIGPSGATYSGTGTKQRGAPVGKPGGEKPFGTAGAPSEAPAAVASLPSPKRQVAGVSKAVELLMEMAKAKADEMSPANPANEPGPVSGAVHGGSGPGQTSVGGTPHGGKGPAQTSVGGTPHGGKGPAQTSVGGSPHGGKGPAQTSVSGPAYAGREGNMNKALTSMALPRLPRADAMNFDQWRSATRVLTAGNSSFAESEGVKKHYGTGPLTGEVLQQVMADSDERATRHMYHRPPGPVYKSCGSCGRTYTIRKSAGGDELGCPSCEVTKSQQCKFCGETMAKSHGGSTCCPIHGVSA
jgi:hypothetical protein